MKKCAARMHPFAHRDVKGEASRQEGPGGTAVNTPTAKTPTTSVNIANAGQHQPEAGIGTATRAVDAADNRAVLEIDYLYLDLAQCTRCQRTREVLHRAVEACRPALDALGLSAVVRETHVTSREMAQAHAFRVSPTILIDGRDVQPEASHDLCAECGDLCQCADGVECRVWVWNGERQLWPHAAFLIDAIVTAATRHRAGGNGDDQDTLPRATGTGREVVEKNPGGPALPAAPAERYFPASCAPGDGPAQGDARDNATRSGHGSEANACCPPSCCP